MLKTKELLPASIAPLLFPKNLAFHQKVERREPLNIFPLYHTDLETSFPPGNCTSVPSLRSIPPSQWLNLDSSISLLSSRCGFSHRERGRRWPRRDVRHAVFLPPESGLTSPRLKLRARGARPVVVRDGGEAAGATLPSAMSLQKPAEGGSGGLADSPGAEEGEDSSPSPSLPPPVLPWDRFSAWLHCVCVVGFDLELGQAVEVGDALRRSTRRGAWSGMPPAQTRPRARQDVQLCGEAALPSPACHAKVARGRKKPFLPCAFIRCGPLRRRRTVFGPLQRPGIPKAEERFFLSPL